MLATSRSHQFPCEQGDLSDRFLGREEAEKATKSRGRRTSFESLILPVDRWKPLTQGPRTKTQQPNNPLATCAILFPLFRLLNKTIDVSRNCWTRELEPQNREYNTEYCLDSKTVHVFAYSSTLEQSNKRSGTRLKQRARLGRDALWACGAHALRAGKTLTPRFSDFFTDFVKKTDCFAV